MKNRLVHQFLVPFVYSLFFTAAMSALMWLMFNYASFNASTLVISALGGFYAFVAIASLVNLKKGNNFLSGASADVLSVGAQKAIRFAGIALALPALLFCGAFAFTLMTFTGDQASLERMCDMESLEMKLFGQSKIWSYAGCQVEGPATAIDPAIGPVEVEPSPPVAPVATYESGVDFGPYMAKLQRTIKRNWFPPKCSTGNEVSVQFKMHRDGTVSDLMIKNSSGMAMSDKAALEAVENGAPYARLPEGAPEVVDIDFTFDYNVFGSGNPLSYSPYGSDTDTFTSSATPEAVKPLE